AEDGIRDFHVTGVQTCALPICHARTAASCHGRSVTVVTPAFSNSGNTWAPPLSMDQVRCGSATKRNRTKLVLDRRPTIFSTASRSEEHTSELQSRANLVFPLLI